jgi:host factor-I protein
MKSNSTAAGRAPVTPDEEFVNRQLIRPPLRKVDSHPGGTATEMAPEPRERPLRRAKPPAGTGERTHAEDFYYQKQMASRTPMTIYLKSGEVVQGIIEWYDRDCIKISRAGKANLLLYKPGIRYMHKADESR